MKSYDDLQRFKEKTQTNHIEFKDMSEQSLSSDTTNWAIIKQLLNDGAGSVLDNSQRIDVAAPEPIDPASFARPPATPVAVPLTQAVQSFASAATADKTGSSLLDSISSSLKPAVTVAPAAEPEKVQPEVDTPVPHAGQTASSNALAGASLFEQLAAEARKPVAPQPSAVPHSQQAVAPQPMPAPHYPQPVVAPARPQPAAAPSEISYKQLFSSAAEPAVNALPKESLLQPLLEKIASCR